MAIEIKQQFEVDAPVDQVWAFVMDPHRVAPCMPGATLDEVIDDKNFRGSVRIKVGAVSAAYKGNVCMQKADQAAGLLEMLAEGRETGGGTARATMTATVTAGDNGTTAVTVLAAVDITGRLMQVGGRMIKGVSDQLFKQFVRKLKADRGWRCTFRSGNFRRRKLRRDSRGNIAAVTGRQRHTRAAFAAAHPCGRRSPAVSAPVRPWLRVKQP